MTEDKPGAPGGQPERPQENSESAAAHGAEQSHGMPSAEAQHDAGQAETTPLSGSGSGSPGTGGQPAQHGAEGAHGQGPESTGQGPESTTGPATSTGSSEAATNPWARPSDPSAGPGYSSQWSQQQGWGQTHYGQQPYPGQQPYTAQFSESGQPGQQPGQPGQQPYAGQSGQASESGQPGQPGQQPYAGQSGQPGESAASTSANPWQAGGPQAGSVPPGQHSGPIFGFHQTAPGQPNTDTAPRSGNRNKFLAGAVVFALLIGGVGGGVGGVVGYEIAKQSAPAGNSLNAPLMPANPTSATPGSMAQVAQRVLPSVVELQVQGATASGDGSGIIISADGLILTNNHVVTDAANGGTINVVFQDGKTVPASIVGTAPNMDLAVVRAQNVSGLTQASLGTSSNLIVGQQVIAIGSPFGLNGTVTQGIVSALHRPVRAGGPTGTQQSVLDAIQTDAPINPGNSGGPLVNMQGQVIGINSAIYSPQTSGSQAGSVGLGFSIPIDQARRIAQELVATGKATEALLGVSVSGTSGGAKVEKVTPGGAADRAGIKAGDVINKVDNRLIPDSDTLVATVRSYAPGTQVKVTLSDGRVLTATLGGTTG